MNTMVLIQSGNTYMKFLGLTGIIIAGLCLSSCQTGNIELDNAGSSDLMVTLDDGVQFQMKAGSFQRIELEKNSPHKISIQDPAHETSRTETFRVEEGGLINLASTQYVIWTELYGSSERRREDLKEDYFEVAGEKLFGDFQFLPRKNDPQPHIYYESQWDYGLDEDFPEDLLGWKITNKKAIPKRKIYREEELKEEYFRLLKAQ